MSKTLAILGAGGHAKVVIGTAEDAGYEVGAVFDDREDLWGRTVLGYSIEGPIGEASIEPFDGALIAVGTNASRRDIAARIDAPWATLVHPSVRLHRSVSLGSGTVVFAGVVLQPDTHIGEHCIVNTSATVDHDCRIGDFCHVAPGVHLAGSVRVGEGCLVGIGAALVPAVAVGEWSVIGAGAVVVSDVLAGVTVVGIPARSQSS